MNLSNYVIKRGLKNATGVYTSNLKPEINKIDVDNLKTVSVDLSRLSSLVNDVVKKNCVW